MTDIYTHRENLVRNHEPRAKALGNNYIRVISIFFNDLECSLSNVSLLYIVKQ